MELRTENIRRLTRMRLGNACTGKTETAFAKAKAVSVFIRNYRT